MLTGAGRGGKFFPGLVAVGHGAGQTDFLIRGEKRNFSDFLKIHPHGVIHGKTVDKGVGVYQFLFFHVGDFLGGGFIVDRFGNQVRASADVNA